MEIYNGTDASEVADDNQVWRGIGIFEEVGVLEEARDVHDRRFVMLESSNIDHEEIMPGDVNID